MVADLHEMAIYYSDARDDCVTKFFENNTNGLMVGLTLLKMCEKL